MKNFMGMDGFQWFIGVVEDRMDPKFLGRLTHVSKAQAARKVTRVILFCGSAFYDVHDMKEFF